MKKIILQILPYSYPSGCGIWSRAYNDSILFTKQGYTSHAFTSNILKGTRQKLVRFEEYSNIKIHRFPIILKLGGSAMFFTFIREFFRVKPDIVIVHGYRHPASLLGLILAKLSRKKVFMTTHAPFGKDPNRSIFMKFIDVAYDILIGWWELRLYNKIIMVAKWEEEVLKKRFKLSAKRLIYISNSIAEEFIENSGKALEKRVELIEASFSASLLKPEQQEAEVIHLPPSKEDPELQTKEYPEPHSSIASSAVGVLPWRGGRKGEANFGASLLKPEQQEAEVIHLPPSKEDFELQTKEDIELQIKSNFSGLYSSVANSEVRGLPSMGGSRKGEANFGASSAVRTPPSREGRVGDASFGADLLKPEQESEVIHHPRPAGARTFSMPSKGESGLQTKSKSIALTNNHYNKSLKNYARENRAKMTKGEVILWSRIKAKQLFNLRFLRQRPIDKYIADFLQPELKLVIEIDGSSHDENKFDYDSKRDEVLKRLGFHTIHFTEHEVVTRTDEVMQSLVNIIEELSKEAELKPEQNAEVIPQPPSKGDPELQVKSNTKLQANRKVELGIKVAGSAVGCLPSRGGRKGDVSDTIIHSAFYMGRIDPTKRPVWVLSVAKELPDYNFYIGGPINNYDKFESDRKNVEIENFVYQKTDFINKAEENLIFLMPSVRETFGLTMVEAMSQACIVISSDTKGAREFIIDGQNGFIVNSPKEMAEKLKQISKMNKEDIIKLINNSVETARKYDSKVIGEKLVGLIGQNIKSTKQN